MPCRDDRRRLVAWLGWSNPRPSGLGVSSSSGPHHPAAFHSAGSEPRLGRRRGQRWLGQSLPLHAGSMSSGEPACNPQHHSCRGKDRGQDTSYLGFEQQIIPGHLPDGIQVGTDVSGVPHSHHRCPAADFLGRKGQLPSAAAGFALPAPRKRARQGLCVQEHNTHLRGSAIKPDPRALPPCLPSPWPPAARSRGHSAALQQQRAAPALPAPHQLLLAPEPHRTAQLHSAPGQGLLCASSAARAGAELPPSCQAHTGSRGRDKST